MRSTSAASAVDRSNRVTKPDGSWREEIRQGNCVTIKERSATGEYKETRQCNPGTPRLRAEDYFDFVELALGPLLDRAVRQAGAGDVLAVADLRAAVGAGEDRPVARRARVIVAMGHPHVEILVGADEAGVGHPLAGVAGVVDRALEADREVEGVELVELLLLVATGL